MGVSQAPFMYESVKRDDDRFPTTTFDPRAVTRASLEPRKKKPRPDGPLVAFGRHPDAHMVPGGRSLVRPMGHRTRGWIKGLRALQLCLRVLEAVGAAGLIVVMALSGLIGWVLGVTLGVVAVHCVYSIYHHSRSAGLRAPASSAAYQLFSGISDLCVLPLYAYGAVTTHNRRIGWETAGPGPADPNVLKYMVPSVYYGLIGAGGLHALSLIISLWLAVMFRRIALMPPDMNPLEANLTSRMHKRNKSSVATASTYSDGETRPDSQQLYDGHRPPPVPFMHTRHDSGSSGSARDSQLDLPDRQYQVAAGKRMSAPPTAPPRASYMEIPLSEADAGPSSPARPTSMTATPVDGRLSSGSVPSYRPESVAAPQTAQPRSAKFTETWYASESLVNRTQQRTRRQKQSGGGGGGGGNVANKLRNYESLRQQQTPDPGSDSDAENNNHHTSSPPHPNPLRSNPTPTTSPTTTPRRPRTPFSRRLRASILSDIPAPNDRHASSDIADASPPGPQQQQQQQQQKQQRPLAPRNRHSSIQNDAAFTLYSKPYGELKPGTPPVLVGGGGRQVSASSGHDFYGAGGGGEGGDLGGGGGVGRRHVSGREAEEGMAGGEGRWLR
ncbi:hypothetical protein BT67DRAFT_380733 [Trichocladium antarcticum]|uniref:Uncharacterized protein n=1 Tax=Trichocladium antarcticum TaxID=1450529 RepID=A0AAN6UJH8_9PEZI|nr:hypothetical protein BT67DRAFT_380733 [Trichocladium antarcticum]